ncbi:hypothetical protein JTE90_016560 [Oedothorax gibbosus]|uniref:Cilia- and flagella-associated protein 57 n=1 Tax=Oedothorax gibbosus TaxID=931172 RepID=A0AAV6UBA6_9ARAC|nr:hypothetical protein JTE90_016560 [Oedothorax gibbosus]
MLNETTAQLQLSEVFGHNCTVKGGLVFTDPDVLFYISGQIGVFHDIQKKGQKFTKICEDNNHITAAYLGLDNCLALATAGKSPTISVFNLKSKERKVLPKPEKEFSGNYVHLAFSADNEFLGGQQGAPDYSFVLWRWKISRLDTVFQPFRMHNGAKVYKFAFCPEDSHHVFAVGNHFLRFYRFKEDIKTHTRQYKIHESVLLEMERSNVVFHSVAWIDKGHAAIGTSDGDILVFEETKIVRKVSLEEQMSSNGNYAEDKSITTLLSYVDGILCSYGSNSVLILCSDFKIIKTIKIPCESLTSYIIWLTFNKEHIAAATKDGRILYHSIADHSQDNLFESELRVVHDFQHSTKVLCSDVAKWPPSSSNRLIATCCSSYVLLRETFTKNVSIRHELDLEPQSISLHPMGTSIAISFRKELKLFRILSTQLLEENTFEIKAKRSQVAFSPSGHLLAVTDGKHIHLVYAIGFKRLASFSSSHSDVVKIVWRNDNFLVSSNCAGTLQEWDILQKKEMWNIEFPNITHTSLAMPIYIKHFYSEQTDVFGKLYSASTDKKIRLIQDGCLLEATATTTSQVTAMAALEDFLIAGTKQGSVLVFSSSLLGPFFESQCHSGRILEAYAQALSVMLIGKDGIISTWKRNGHTEEEVSSTFLEEVLTDVNEYETMINRIDDLEKELNSQVQEADEVRTLQNNVFETALREEAENYKSIELSLQTVVADLKKEMEEMKTNNKTAIHNKESLIRRNIKENEEDFKAKILKEEEYMQQAEEDRISSMKKLQLKIEETTEEKRSYEEAFQARHLNYKDKVHELEVLLEQEIKVRQEIEKELEDITSQPKETKNNRCEELEFKEILQEQKQCPENSSEIEGLNKMVLQEKEYGRILDDEIKRKKGIFHQLQERSQLISAKVDQVREDILRMDRIIKDKGDMIQELERDIDELSIKNEDNLTDYEKQLQTKEQELENCKGDLQKCRDMHRIRTFQLQRARREEVLLNERLMATENSVKENAKQLFASENLMEKCRQEFLHATVDCNTKASLRRALLKLYDERVTKIRAKDESGSDEDINPYTNFYRQRDHYESLISNIRSRTAQVKETFRGNYVKLAKCQCLVLVRLGSDEDINPYTNFYRQRDHYESLISNIRSRTAQVKETSEGTMSNLQRQRDHYESLISNIRSRTAQVKETFRGNYVKLAKENSDLASHAESLRSDIRAYKSRIKKLEKALGMASDQFRLDPVLTRNRLEEAAARISSQEAEVDEELRKRRNIVAKQEEEIRRLHGILSVGEKGRKIRQMPR